MTSSFTHISRMYSERRIPIEKRTFIPVVDWELSWKY